MKCEFCGCEHAGTYGSGRFCNNICSRRYSSLIHNEERKKHISESINKLIPKEHKIPEHKYCKDCEKEICNYHKNIYCVSCAARHRSTFYKINENNPEYEKLKYRLYRSKCAFNFSIRDYPEEFDINLIEQYGFYKPSNRGNNLNGISRDHMYSVNEGYKNGIDPKIISHPANCKLMQHNDNISKGKKSTITLDELLKRIKEWDLKYNK